MGLGYGVRLAAALALAAAMPAGAQVTTATQTGLPAAPPAIETPDQALARDAATFAERTGIAPAEAVHQLAVQEASVPVTDALQVRFADRLAGIAIDHQPVFRLVVLLTGDAPVPDESVVLDGLPVPIVFHTGAKASRTELVQAIASFQATIRSQLVRPPGLGVDPRTGELVIVVGTSDAALVGAATLRAQFAALTHVPVRIRVLDQPVLDMAGSAGGGILGGGGGRVVGLNPADGHRYACTTGFVVTDGARTGIATAAHCPDDLSYVGPDRQEVPLPFVGQWGWGNQDVQVNASAAPLAPLFFADTAKTVSRAVTGSRARASMRAGDVVCHRGERTGYSCSEVELTDFAPAGDLCGGACLPTWVTVKGPTCRSGDSGSPVFLGTTAFGILKGGSYRGDGSCAFYFYMSTDYLPTNWRLLTAADAVTAPPPRS